MNLEYILSPSILSADFCHLQDDIRKTEEAGAQYLHFDVMDGMFVRQISFGMPVLKSISRGTKLVKDVHLMIEDPIRYIDAFADAGADIITFHLEAVGDPQAVIDAIHKAGCRAGLSVKPKTPVEEAFPFFSDLDMLLIMTVEPGFGGQKYMPECARKAIAAREYMKRSGREFDIEADGGINKDTIADAAAQGINVFVAGSAVFRGDIYENAKALMDYLGTLPRR